MPHCVLGNTLGQQAGVNPHRVSGDVENPGDLNITGFVTSVQVYSLTCSTARLPTSSCVLSPTTWSYQAPPIITVNRVLFPWGNVQLS